ncbi:MAG: hypothetical protein HY514_00270 [Candidatus Aenigmarchaeota archaeon]|nr:hypothetical protein [Candidatus Aenigmarchaeota archaeon]
MLFQTTEDRIKKLEKRVDEIEKQMNRTLTSIHDALGTITSVITKLQEENTTLKKEKDVIAAKQKQIASQIKDIGIKKDIKLNIVEPVKNIVTENFEFVQEIAKEGFTGKPSMQNLLDLVEKEGEIRMQDAATKMKVHEVQIEHWANTMRNRITVTEKKNKKYLCAIKQRNR